MHSIHSVAVIARPAAFIFAAAVLLIALFLPDSGTAQEAFTDCPERTATNATLLLPEDLTVRDEHAALAPPLTLVVVNEEGACAGTATWTGSATALTVWGAGSSALPTSAASAPLSPEDSLHLRVYDTAALNNDGPVRDASLSLRTTEDHYVSHSRYVPNGLYVVDAIRVQTPLSSDAAPRP